MALNTVKFSQFAQGSYSTATNMIVGVTADSGGTNFQLPAVASWTTGGRPISPVTGIIGYNTSLGQYEFWNGASWVQLAAGGSGSVNLGGAGQVAYYATNGTAVSGTNTIPNTVDIQGVTDGTNATTGIVGEFVSSVVPGASSIFLTVGVPANVTSISLTAGDWDIFGNIFFNGMSVNDPNFFCWISFSSATVPDPSLYNSTSEHSDSMAVNIETGIQCPYFRASITATTTVYLSASMNSLGSPTVSACGGIFARRAR